MSRLIESIRLFNGTFFNLPYHRARMEKSIADLYHQDSTINLHQQLESTTYPVKGLYKCRVVYDLTIHKIEFVPYVPQAVKSLRIVRADDVKYPYKFENRSALDALFQLREGCDDIIIVKNGWVTDSYYSNLIFYNGSEWITPARPLLKGTMRQCLIDVGRIREAPIQADHLPAFRSCRLVNAMLGFNGPELSVSQIVF
jgi:4-amino-4-deoxychorismate lyase